MEITLTNKTAIITGAGQGIGLRIAELLHASGANIILNDVDATLCKQAAAKVGSRCIPMIGDSSDTGFIQKMVNTAVETFGILNIAIANAGITLFGEFNKYPVDDFDRVMNVNMRGTFYLAQLASNQMIKQGKGGSLLFTSSVTGHQAHKNLAAYSMTKAGIEMLAKNLVSEIAEFGINVNCIAPGATLTERTLEDPDYTKTWSKLTPMKRPGTVDDVANAAIFLVSDQAKQITGQSLVIDGGWSAMSPSPY
ncbi:MAG: SDR family NAD(P)-dependent oxidoreductase [Chitinophagaceae bacterium]